MYQFNTGFFIRLLTPPPGSRVSALGPKPKPSALVGERPLRPAGRGGGGHPGARRQP